MASRSLEYGWSGNECIARNFLPPTFVWTDKVLWLTLRTAGDFSGPATVVDSYSNRTEIIFFYKLISLVVWCQTIARRVSSFCMLEAIIFDEYRYRRCSGSSISPQLPLYLQASHAFSIAASTVWNQLSTRLAVALKLLAVWVHLDLKLNCCRTIEHC